MDLWIVSPDPTTPVSAVRKLNDTQALAAREGSMFIVKATSPVFARSLAESLRSMADQLPAMDNEALAPKGLFRRQVRLAGASQEFPVYEALLYWPQ